MRPTQAIVDLAAIRHNIRLLASCSQEANLLAVVKANAYGHGAVPVSKAALAAGAVSLAVAIPEEGAELREAGIAVPILVLGLISPEQAETVVKHRLITPVCTEEGAATLSAEAIRQGRKAQVMVKLDTGMGRIGLPAVSLLAFIKSIQKLPGLKLMGLFTHLATADAQNKTYANKQIAGFAGAVEGLKAAGIELPYISAANSACILDLPAAHFNLVRAGIAMYGFLPSGEMLNRPALKPAMTFKTRIVYLKEVEAGAKIGYGSTYTVPSATFIATLPVGYADGYSRKFSNKAQVLIGGRRRPVIGRVCMDQIMVDLGPVCDAEVGDEAILFGKQGEEEITATELASIAGTIDYELLCAVSARVPRVYVNE